MSILDPNESKQQLELLTQIKNYLRKISWSLSVLLWIVIIFIGLNVLFSMYHSYQVKQNPLNEIWNTVYPF